MLNKRKIDNLTELDFAKIIASLWAYAGWGNKEYVSDRMLENTGFDELKQQLKNILNGSDPFPKRYDDFFKTVKYIGPAGLTEILALWTII